MKTRSEQGNKESRSLKIIQTDLVPASPVRSPDLFKKQILLLNERQNVKRDHERGSRDPKPLQDQERGSRAGPGRDLSFDHRSTEIL